MARYAGDVGDLAEGGATLLTSSRVDQPSYTPPAADESAYEENAPVPASPYVQLSSKDSTVSDRIPSQNTDFRTAYSPCGDGGNLGDVFAQAKEINNTVTEQDQVTLDIGHDDKYTTIHWNEDTEEYFWGAEGTGNCYLGKHIGKGDTAELNLGTYNVGIGAESGYLMRAGHYNVWAGFQSMAFSTTPVYSVAVGYQSGYYMDDGRGNTFVGAKTGYYTSDVTTYGETRETPTWARQWEDTVLSNARSVGLRSLDGQLIRFGPVSGASTQTSINTSDDKGVTWTERDTTIWNGVGPMNSTHTCQVVFNGMYLTNIYYPNDPGEGWLGTWDGVNMGVTWTNDDYYPLSPNNVFCDSMIVYGGLLYAVTDVTQYVTNGQRAVYWSADASTWTKVTYYKDLVLTYWTYGINNYEPQWGMGYGTRANELVIFNNELFWMCSRYESSYWNVKAMRLESLVNFSEYGTFAPSKNYMHPFKTVVVGDTAYIFVQELSNSGSYVAGLVGGEIHLYTTKNMTAFTKVATYTSKGTVSDAIWFERELVLVTSSSITSTLGHHFIYRINPETFVATNETQITSNTSTIAGANFCIHNGELYLGKYMEVWKRTRTTWGVTEQAYDLQSSYNTFIGIAAGYTNVYGQGNTCIGAFADLIGDSRFNATAIGYKAQCESDNTIILGGTGDYAVNVGINRTSAGYTLDVAGDARFTGQVTSAVVTGTAPFVVSSTTVVTNLNADLWDGYHQFMSTTGAPTGFVNRTGSTLSWNDGNRTLTITGTSFVVWLNGVSYTLNTDTSQIADTSAMYYFYYEISSSTLNLVNSTTWPGFGVPLVATVYWNTVAGMDKGLLADERHGVMMDQSTHEYLHETVGCRYESGLAGTFADTTFSVAAGYIHDEDIDFSITPAQTACDVLYLDGSTTWKWLANQTVYYYTSGGNLYWNNGTTLTAAGANKYVAVWIFATLSPVRPIVSIIGQVVSDTIADARLNNTYQGLSLGILPFKEMKLLYRVILRNDVTPYEETQDLRSVSNVSSGTYVATAHNTLTSLTTGDDHTQYAYCKISATAAPAATDDIDTCREGTIWVEQDANAIWICADNTDGAAVWHGLDQDLRTADSPNFAGLSVGTNDVARGLLYLYGHEAGGAFGGTLVCHTSADYDGTIGNYGFMVKEDDLLIGPDTNVDALLLDSNDDLYITGGSLILPASEYVNFGGTLGSGGYGVRDNAGTMEFCNSGGAWTAMGSGGGGAFLDLTDCDEADYVGHEGDFVIVNATADGLIFTASSVAGHDILSASHTDSLASAVSRGSIIYGNSTPKWAELAVGNAGDVLTSDGTDVAWAAPSGGGAHNMLSVTHSDTLADTVIRGDILYGNATPKWARLAKGTSAHVLTMGANEPSWAAIPAVKLDDAAAPDDNTDLDVSASAHGLAPKRDGSALSFLSGAGTWIKPGMFTLLNESFDALSTAALGGQGSYTYFGTWASTLVGATTINVTAHPVSGKMVQITGDTVTEGTSYSEILTTFQPGLYRGTRIRFKMRTSNVAVGTKGFYVAQAVNTGLMQIYFRNTSKITFWSGSAATDLMNSANDTWYQIDVIISGGTTGANATIWIDGVQQGAPKACGANSDIWDIIGIYTNTTSTVANTNMDFDDLQVGSVYFWDLAD